MQIICFAWGILSILGVIIAFFPCLGSLNWIVIPFSFIGLLISYFTFKGVKPGEPYRASKVAIYMNAVAVLIGLIRLAIGGGVL